MCLDKTCSYPFTADWQLHPDTIELTRVQQLHKGNEESEEEADFDTQSDEEGSQDASDEDDSQEETISSNPFALLAGN